MLSNVGEAFERLVVRKHAEGGTPKMITEAFDAPYHAVSLEINRGLMALSFKGSAAAENNRAYRAVL